MPGRREERSLFQIIGGSYRLGYIQKGIEHGIPLAHARLQADWACHGDGTNSYFHIVALELPTWARPDKF